MGCAVQRFTSAFRSVLFYPILFILFLQAFPMLVVAGSGVPFVLLGTLLGCCW
ncbi:hypothetical protein HanXRQr2_Chr11g0492171 [Helianthus annuus]|uniref:Uncharacterized protein n=1 Tax=Helianthus annuus TaxID=4232 RepID=A0A251T420_HELAN|nr:hypothetical protein HanXRQr2_Chr11g0492171 [Helianthus annuus]KAJ0501666.1 hypothetical protein HanHA300_Chr11g0403361 [Helianthus annuus]KAJ0517580.1 hypothetical protein HanHA89_Chr11g0426951 [Helianthus annuus]KAJ0685591.1 hypothetical protein HanLR1_Chr11g0404401 [Helianthus annuus]KAJ0875280.1 hypothetical protein HanPSC8_Chr11g0474311 [Helianthus annuus]